MLKTEKVDLSTISTASNPELVEWETGIRIPNTEISPLEKSMLPKADGSSLWKSESIVPKSKLRKQLEEEQFYLCAYCGQNLHVDSFPIEHLLAKSKYAHLTFNYYNLVGSCEGNEPLNERISVIAQVHGKTLKEVFDNQSTLFPKNRIQRNTFVKIKVGKKDVKDKEIPNIVKPTDDFFLYTKIDKEKITSITFMWSDEKCCDANKEDKLIYLLPLSNKSLDRLKQDLPENEQAKFFSIDDNIEFLSNGEVKFNEAIMPNGFKEINKVLNLNYEDLKTKRKRIYDDDLQIKIEGIKNIPDTDSKRIVIQAAINQVEEEKGEFYFMKLHFFKTLLQL